MCFVRILVITSIIVPYLLLCALGMLLTMTIEIKKRCGNMSTILAVCKGICLFGNPHRPSLWVPESSIAHH